MIAEPKKEIPEYIAVARQRFCEGTGYRVPSQVVQNGVKTIMDWCETVGFARMEYKAND